MSGIPLLKFTLQIPNLVVKVVCAQRGIALESQLDPQELSVVQAHSVPNSKQSTSEPGLAVPAPKEGCSYVTGPRGDDQFVAHVDDGLFQIDVRELVHLDLSLRGRNE
jgi:hypothetical protein